VHRPRATAAGASAAPRGAVIDNEHPALASFWHPVAASADLGDQPISVTLLGNAWVVARLDDGLVALPDRCPHRLAPLSAGVVEGDRLRCAYHGYAFDRAGRCVDIPAQSPDLPIPPRASVGAAAGVVERYGLVWIAPEEPRWPIPDFAEWDDPRWTRQELAFVCWTRETGVVPAALVGVLAALGVPNGDLLASVVALAILVTLAIQAVPAPWLAQRLGLLEVD
jgi:phenylpropionate dioxygenase-like ring-hydroxylating dioxygenase large terminal subunit